MNRPVRLQGPGADGPTPYLREMFSVYENAICRGRRPLVVDLGAGAGEGRNSAYLRGAMCCLVHAYDGAPDGPLVKQWYAGDRLPGYDKPSAKADLVLCQYLLMFLDDSTIAKVLDEVDRICRPGGFAIIEVEDVKQGREVRIPRVVLYMNQKGWVCVNQRRKHCTLHKSR